MKTIFNTTVLSDLARAYRIRNELAAWDSRLACLPDPATTPEPAAATTPSAVAEEGEPGPAVQDGSPGSGPAAGPGETPEPAPGAPLEDTPPADGGPAEPPGTAVGPGRPVTSAALPPERCGLLLSSGATCERLADHEGDCAPVGDVVTPEEIAAEFGPAPVVEHDTGTSTPMAPCQQPEAHGVWEDGRGQLPAECDVPEHHEDAQDAEAETALDAEPQP
jgi:hypothetical protein